MLTETLHAAMDANPTMSRADIIRDIAEKGATLCSYADPVDDARVGLTVEQAIELAECDLTLIYWTFPA